MRKLVMSEALRDEFAAVAALWQSEAETRRVDALALSWIKYEKQLRRLFSFFVFRHPKVTEEELDGVIAAFAGNRNLFPETFISAMRALGVPARPNLMGEPYARLWPEIERIRQYRNKIMHGQNTGKKLSSLVLEKDVQLLIDWISSLAGAADNAFGYDGLKRNTFSAAKKCTAPRLPEYPFSSVQELNGWLSKLNRRRWKAIFARDGVL
jgi:hypothetical protein